MSEELGTALLLLVVGMITVFIVLLLVVLSGQTLIRIVNRFRPAKISNRSKPALVTSLFQNIPSTQIIPSKLAALVAAVEVATQGKGKIQSIEKIE